MEFSIHTFEQNDRETRPMPPTFPKQWSWSVRDSHEIDVACGFNEFTQETARQVAERFLSERGWKQRTP